MTQTDVWLIGRNLAKKADLEGEALAYALVTYAVRRDAMPQEVVELLAESFFKKLLPSDGPAH